MRIVKVRCELSPRDKQRLFENLEKDLKQQRNIESLRAKVEDHFEKKRIRLIMEAEQKKILIDEAHERIKAVMAWEIMMMNEDMNDMCNKFEDQITHRDLGMDLNVEEPKKEWSSTFQEIDDTLIPLWFGVLNSAAIMACVGLLWKGLV